MGGIVRKAGPDDTKVFTAIAEQFVLESPMYKGIAFDHESYEIFLRYVFESDQYLALIYEQDGEVAGAIMGMICSFLYSPELQASDLGFYVKPEYRGKRVAVKLEAAYREWARSKGARKVALGVTTGDKTAGAFYERLGYTYVGSNYAMMLD